MELHVGGPRQIAFRAFDAQGVQKTMSNVSVIVNNIGVSSSLTAETQGNVATAIVPASFTELEGVVIVAWTYTVDGNQTTSTEKYNVVTPYAHWSQVKKMFEDFGKTYADFLKAEAISRFIINQEIGHSFGKRAAVKLIDGQGINNLFLSEPLLSVNSVTYENYENVTQHLDHIFEITGEGFFLRRKSLKSKLDPVYQSSFKFHRDLKYIVNGIWGYESVPDEINKACLLLIEDFICPEPNYRNKYIGNIRFADTRVEYVDQAFTGTGNALVDSLLAPYKTVNMGVI